MPESVKNQTILITGSRKGIGKYLVDYYLEQGFRVAGCSRSLPESELPGYRHFCLDVADENAVKEMFRVIAKEYGGLQVLINNAGIAVMNSALLTPLSSAQRILETNLIGAFLMSREAAKLMQRQKFGRIVNFTSVAVPLKLEGEALYAASKAGLETLTQILARELAPLGITVNAVGPPPVQTDLIRSVPEEKLKALIKRQAIPRLGEFRDIANVIDFFVRKESDFITGQIIYLGGV